MKTRLLYTLVALCAAAFALAGGARAGDGPTTYYVSLGDSLAAGDQPIGGPGGFGGYVSSIQVGTGVGYAQGYADQLYRTMNTAQPGLQLVKLGCDDTSAGSIINGVYYCRYPQGTQLAEAVAFLNAHPGQTELITIDVGGNDIVLPLVGGTCFDEATGVLSITCVQATLPTIEANLTTIIQTLRAAVRDARRRASLRRSTIGSPEGCRRGAQLYRDPCFPGWRESAAVLVSAARR